MSRDPRYVRMISSARWQRLRCQKLTETPACEECARAGIVRSATEVHHARPVETAKTAEGMAALMFDYDNLRSLCRQCHREAHMRMGQLTKTENAKRKKNEAKAFSIRMFGDVFQSQGKPPGGGFFKTPGGPSKPDPSRF